MKECGILGSGDTQMLQKRLISDCTVFNTVVKRGGILSNDAGQLKQYRDTGLLSEVFRNPTNLDKLTGTGAIGHVRYATAGEASVDNIQPFLFRFHDTVGLAHSRVTNAKSLKQELENNRAIFGSSDSILARWFVGATTHPSWVGEDRWKVDLLTFCAGR